MKWNRFFAATLGALMIGASANAQTIYTSELSFTAAAGATVIESFESNSAQSRGSSAIVTPRFTVSPSPSMIGIQTGADAPDPGFGGSATDGTNYLSIYRPNDDPGTLIFELLRPTKVLGFHIVDMGEANSTILVTTDAGEASTGVSAFSAGGLSNGNVAFFGLVQGTAFTKFTLVATGLDEAFGLDKFYLQDVPEPGAMGMVLGAVVVGVGFLRRRR